MSNFQKYYNKSYLWSYNVDNATMQMDMYTI